MRGREVCLWSLLAEEGEEEEGVEEGGGAQ